MTLSIQYLKIEKKYKNKIDGAWSALYSLNPKVFSIERELASINSVSIGKKEVILQCEYTDYKTYSSLSRLSAESKIDACAYKKMRIAAIGVVLFLTKDEIFIQRRSKKASHVPGVIDSSCGGLCNVQNNMINYYSCVCKKVKEELHLESSEINIRGISGIHSTNKPDLSGTVSFIIETKVPPKEFIKRNIDSFEEFFVINKKDLLSFIIKNLYVQIGWEGVATLLTSLNREEKQEIIRIINKDSKIIKSGYLNDGKFIESNRF